MQLSNQMDTVAQHDQLRIFILMVRQVYYMTEYLHQFRMEQTDKSC